MAPATITALRTSRRPKERRKRPTRGGKPRRMKDKPSIIEFVRDRQLLGLSLSEPQEVLLRSIYGIPLTPTQAEIYCQCTGRQYNPGISFQEATILAGARAGKDSRVACPIASYEACFGDHQNHLT